jgi:YVTN family beta-propeller protein
MKKIFFLVLLILSFSLAQQLETFITVGRWPIDLCWDSIHNKVFVVNQQTNSAVWVINGENNQIVGTIENVGNQAQRILFNPRANKVYVGNLSSNDVAVIDANNNSLITRVNVGGSVYDIALDVNNNLLCCATANGVAIIDGNNNSLVNLVPVNGNPVGIYYLGATGKIYCLASRYGQNGFMHVIDAPTGNLERSVNLLLDPQGFAYNPNNNKIYVANYSSNRLSIIQLPNYDVSNVQVGQGPKGIAYSPINNYVYVANSGSNDVTIINGATNAVVGTISNLPNPTTIFYGLNSNRLYVNSYNGDKVYIINPQTNTIVLNFTVGQGVNRFAYNRTNQRVYAPISWEDKVVVFRDVVGIEEAPNKPIIKEAIKTSQEIYQLDGRRAQELKKGIYLLKVGNSFRKLVKY